MSQTESQRVRVDIHVLNPVIPTSCSQFKLCIPVSVADVLLIPGAMLIPIGREGWN